MSVLNQLASAQQTKSDEPNKLLAENIAVTEDKTAIKELVDNLANKDKNIQSDCIKTLYVIAEKSPQLIAPHAATFITLLTSKNNRMIWGAMTTLSAIATECAPVLYKAIAPIVDIADKGTVITKDHAVNILVKLSTFKEYAPDTIPLLLEQILAAPINQMPTYAEKALPVIDAEHKPAFLDVLTTRLPDIEGDAKRKRLEKVIKRVRA